LNKAINVLKLKCCVITSRNNASISNFLGGFRWRNKYPWCIIEVKNILQQFSKNREKQKKKLTEKREFLRKTSFRPNRFFYMVIHHDIFLFSNFYEICQKRENLQDYKYNTNISRRHLKMSPSQFFLLAFEVQILTKNSQNHEYLT
ncbi:Uncharacterized protein FWK35_00011226, partial [Aphis craccivora]